MITALIIGAPSGSITSISGAAIYRARGWQVYPIVRLALGGLALASAAIILSVIAAPSAAVGRVAGDHLGRKHSCFGVYRARGCSAPCGSHHIFRSGRRMRRTVRAIHGNRRSWGRVFAPSLEYRTISLVRPVQRAGGYHLPLHRARIVLGQGGPKLAMLTCLATVAAAVFARRSITFRPSEHLISARQPSRDFAFMHSIAYALMLVAGTWQPIR